MLITLKVLKNHVPPPLPERRLGQILINLSAVTYSRKHPKQHRAKCESGSTCDFYGLTATVGVKLFRSTEQAAGNAAIQHLAWSRRLAPKVLCQPFEIALQDVTLYGFLTERANIDSDRTNNAEYDEDTSAEGRKYRKLCKVAKAYAGGAYLDLHSHNIGWLGNRPVIVDVDGFPGSPRVGTRSGRMLSTAQVAEAKLKAAKERKRIEGIERAQKARDAKAKALELDEYDEALIHNAGRRADCCGVRRAKAWPEFCRRRDLLRSVAREGCIGGFRAAACRRWLVACRDGNIDVDGLKAPQGSCGSPEGSSSHHKPSQLYHKHKNFVETLRYRKQ